MQRIAAVRRSLRGRQTGPSHRATRGRCASSCRGSDPTQAVEPSLDQRAEAARIIAGTQPLLARPRSRGLNGDGKLDVLMQQGWWEQPDQQAEEGKWAFHPYRIPACSDIYAVDLDGDGKADLVSSSAHETGFWWHQQRAGKGTRHSSSNLFPRPVDVAKKPVDGVKLEPEEAEVLAALAKARADQKHVPWRGNADLIADARAQAELGEVGTSRASIPARSSPS